MPITKQHQDLIERCVDALRDDHRVLGAWVDGSLGQGAGDEHSDVDVHCYVADDDLPAFDTAWRELAGAITTPVWSFAIGASAVGQVGGAVIGRDYEHLDLMVFGRSRLEGRTWAGVTPLFDEGGVLPAAPVPPAPPGPPTFPRHVVELYLYALGQMPVVVGRGEVERMLAGLGVFLDQCLLPLFFAERGIDPKGGVKRLRAFLTAEQRAVLATMPPIVLDLDALVAWSVWLAELLLPRARSLAAATGAEYPDEFEAATLRHLQDRLGVTIRT